MQPAARVSDDEYIAFERASEEKHELINGMIVTRASCSVRHNVITGNLLGAIGTLLKQHRCFVFSSSMRLHAEATGLYTYADAVVTHDELRLHPKFSDTLLNPHVIFEVLSDSTEAYDRGAKFSHYQSIPSLEEYVLVSQHESKIEYFRRLETGQWILTTYRGESAVASLPALGCELPLAEVYDKLDMIPPAS